MCETSTDMDSLWYCEVCKNDKECYNCFDCSIMDELIDNRRKIFIIVEEFPVNKKENQINTPLCWTCWMHMKVSKRKQWAKYWCPCRW